MEKPLFIFSQMSRKYFWRKKKICQKTQEPILVIAAVATLLFSSLRQVLKIVIL